VSVPGLTGSPLLFLHVGFLLLAPKASDGGRQIVFPVTGRGAAIIIRYRDRARIDQTARYQLFDCRDSRRG
jgi:hypothetical protein